MKILVLNGSPSGEKSITLQYIQYFRQIHPKQEIEVVPVSQNIRKLENDEAFFREVMEQVKKSDAVLWSFPVYIFSVPAQMKRFIELIWERNAVDCFAGKYTVAVSTSIHFYDTTAHHYVQGICDDLDMRYAGHYSACMGDLLKEQERKQFDLFIERFLKTAEQKRPTAKRYAPLAYPQIVYEPGVIREKFDLQGKKVVIFSDAADRTSNLAKIVEYVSQCFDGEVTTVNLWESKINGGCVGCMKCTLDNQCVYEEKDDIAEMYDVLLPQADIVIYAATIKDRFLSSRFKLFMDRRFRNTHQPNLVGKQLGFLVQGPLSQLADLNWYFEAEAEVNEGNLCAVVSDEAETSAELDALLTEFARGLAECAGAKCVATGSFAGIGAKKIFRDAVWGELRFVFQGDHNYYKTHGWYDFPQYDKKTKTTNRIMMTMTKIPKVRQTMRSQMRDMMLKPYREFLEKNKQNEK